jgi:hypothetical protein
MNEAYLSTGWPKSRVVDALNRKGGCELAEFLRERYSERFFEPIRCLKACPQDKRGYGFSVVAQSLDSSSPAERKPKDLSVGAGELVEGISSFQFRVSFLHG